MTGRETPAVKRIVQQAGRHASSSPGNSGKFPSGIVRRGRRSTSSDVGARILL
jgi:hypothetical protein